MKADDGGVAEADQRPSPDRAAEGVGCVEDERQLTFPRQPLEAVEISVSTPEVDAEQGRGLRADPGLGLRRPHAERRRFDVGEDRRQPLPGDGVGGSGKGEGGQDHLPAHPQRPHRDLQPQRRVAGGDAVQAAEDLGEP